MSNDQLEAIFSKVGTPDSCQVVMDRDTGKSKGFGFVEFKNPEQAKQALTLDGTEVGGRALKVNEARPKTENRESPRRSRY
jgi:RNA recognition motif-containing protein